MLKVTGLYKKEGELFGFHLEDGGPIRVTPMSLYIEENIKDLVGAGYQFTDYNPENIKLPNGKSIMSLPEFPMDARVEFEIRSSKAGLSQVLSDAQASRYYSSSTATDTNIEFVKYPGPFLINTREELHDYVTRAEATMRQNPCKVEIRPLNTLVNPDIWFTPEEILTSTDNIYYRLCALRKWGNFEHLMRTVQFFIEQGLMTEDDINMRSILRAWYAYGPDLIKGQFTESHISLDVDGDFYNNDRLASTTIKMEGEYTMSTCAVNRRGTLAAYSPQSGKLVSWTGEEVDVDSILSLDRGRRYSLHTSDVMLNKLKMSNSDSEAIPVKVGIVDATDRFYCTIVSNGCTYKYKADAYRIQLLYSSKDVFCCDSAMRIATVTTAYWLPLDEVKNYTNYQKFLIAQLYTLLYSKSNTVEPISGSNSTYLNQLHMTPTGIIKKYGSRKDPRGVVHPLAKDWGDYRGLGEILALYTQPIPFFVAQSLGVSEDMSKSEFLKVADIESYTTVLSEAGEAADNPKPDCFIPVDAKRSEVPGLIADMESRGITDDPYNYYYKIKLVEDALSGFSEYGCLEEGHLLDSEINAIDGAKALFACVNALYGYDCTVEEFAKAIETLETRVDFKLLYRKREAAAVGYVRDFASDAELMCSRDTFYWLYVTKVFRELSNKPVLEQRPYLLEVLCVGKTNKADNVIREAFMQIAESALEATPIVPDYNYNYTFGCEGDTITSPEKLSKKFAGYFASRLMFNCLIGVKSGRLPVDQPYTETAHLFEDASVVFVVPAAILAALQGFDLESHRKYVPVHFFCTYDVMENSEMGHSQLYCVNAEITPWSVKSLPGYQIKSYPLMYNYYDASTLINTFGEQKVTGLVATKTKCTESIMAKTKGSWQSVKNSITREMQEVYVAPESSLQSDLSLAEDLVRHATTPEEFNVLLEDAYANESIAAYVKRWTLEKKRAADAGKVILSIPLKQDILYGEIGETLGYDIVQFAQYTDDVSCKANFLAEDVIVLPTADGSMALTQKMPYTLEAINTNNVDEKITKNFSIIINTPMLPAVVSYGMIITADGYVGTDWIKENFIQLSSNKYIGHLQNGYFVYEEE